MCFGICRYEDSFGECTIKNNRYPEDAWCVWADEGSEEGSWNEDSNES